MMLSFLSSLLAKFLFLVIKRHAALKLPHLLCAIEVKVGYICDGPESALLLLCSFFRLLLPQNPLLHFSADF